MPQQEIVYFSLKTISSCHIVFISTWTHKHFPQNKLGNWSFLPKCVQPSGWQSARQMEKLKFCQKSQIKNIFVGETICQLKLDVVLRIFSKKINGLSDQSIFCFVKIGPVLKIYQSPKIYILISLSNGIFPFNSIWDPI